MAWLPSAILTVSVRWYWVRKPMNPVKNRMPLPLNQLLSTRLPMIWNAISSRVKPCLSALTVQSCRVNAAIKSNSALVSLNTSISRVPTQSSTAYPSIRRVWIWAFLWRKKSNASCPSTISMSWCRFLIPADPARWSLPSILKNLTAKVWLKTAISAAPLLCPDKQRVKNPYAKSSARWKPNLTAKAFCWWMIPSCVVRPAVKSLKWYARQVRAKSTLLPLLPKCAIRMCTVSICRPVKNWLQTAAAQQKSRPRLARTASSSKT